MDAVPNEETRKVYDECSNWIESTMQTMRNSQIKPELLPKAEQRPIAFTVYGVCYSMKNGKTNHVKHPKCKAFERDFALQVPPEAKRSLGGKNVLLRAIVRVFYPTWKQDVDVEVVWDLLQSCGVISNDRWLREKHVYGAHIDRINPRVEITVEEI